MCRHYGFRDGAPVCALGIDIRVHVGGPKFGWLCRIPCVSTSLSRDVIACDRADLVNSEELFEGQKP